MMLPPLRHTYHASLASPPLQVPLWAMRAGMSIGFWLFSTAEMTIESGYPIHQVGLRFRIDAISHDMAAIMYVARAAHSSFLSRRQHIHFRLRAPRPTSPKFAPIFRRSIAASLFSFRLSSGSCRRFSPLGDFMIAAHAPKSPLY